MVKGFPVVLSDRGAPFVAVEKNAPLATVAENGRGLPIRLVEKGAPPIILQGGAPWDPIDLFANGEYGAWYDPSDLSTVFQNSAGTTPGAPGSPVGLLMDKHLGGELGPELFTGQAGSVINASGGAVSSWDDGTMTLTISTAGSSSVYPRIRFNLGLINGRVYRVVGKVVRGGGADLSATSPVRLATTGSANDIHYTQATGVFSGQVAAASAIIEFIADGTKSGSIKIEELSVKEVLGLHASQATTSARPTLRTGGGKYWLLDDLADDALNVTPPSDDYTVAYIDSDGNMTIEEEVAISGAYDILKVEKLSGLILLNRSMSDAEKANLAAYWGAAA